MNESQMTMTKTDLSGSLLWILLGAWLAAALTAGVAGWWAAGVLRIGPPLVGGTMLGTALSGIFLTHFVAPVRDAVRRTSWRALILIHFGRVFGFLFLFYSGAGLPSAWAIPAAWADVAVAVAAIPVALFAAPLTSKTRRRAVMLWNILAAIDILAAPGSGILLALNNPDSMRAMGQMPLGIIPMFFVPLMIISQVLITERLLAKQ